LLDITQGIKRNLIDFCDGLCHAVAWLFHDYWAE
jgi:hypothetical protein